MEQSSNICVDVGHVRSKTKKRWLSATLAPGRGFEVVVSRQDTQLPFAHWLYSLASDDLFSIVGCGDELVNHNPLTSQEAARAG